MSAPRAGEITSVAFGAPGGGIAGAAAFWDGGACSTFGSSLRLEGSEGERRLVGDGVELTVTAVGEAAELELADAGVAATVQLARVRGVAGEHEVDCGGQLARRRGGPDGKRFAALRALTAWFDDDEGVAILAARPRKARGHESDVLAAVLFEGGVAAPVADPRVSTTYAADGVLPRRVGLELWMSADDEAEEYPRRAVADALGPSLACDGAGRSELLRWRMRGREGVGLYVLTQAA